MNEQQTSKQTNKSTLKSQVSFSLQFQTLLRSLNSEYHIPVLPAPKGKWRSIATNVFAFPMF